MRINCEINRLDSTRKKLLFSLSKEQCWWCESRFEWVVSTGGVHGIEPQLSRFLTCAIFFILSLLHLADSRINRRAFDLRRFSISRNHFYHSLKFFLLLCHSVYKHLSNLWIVNSITSWYCTVAIYNRTRSVSFCPLYKTVLTDFPIFNFWHFPNFFYLSLVHLTSLYLLSNILRSYKSLFRVSIDNVTQTICFTVSTIVSVVRSTYKTRCS